MATLGQELKEERERKALSLKDISDRTKIGTRILIALENDRWSEMPQKFFLKGVIKTYAEAIGADPAVYLAKYEEQLAARSEAADKDRVARGWKKPEPQNNIGLDPEKAPGRRRWLRAFLVTAILLAAAAAVIFLIIKPGRKHAVSDRPAKVAAPIAAVAAPAETSTKEAEPKAVETGLRLEFRFQADCWMHVTADRVVVMDGIQTAGSRAERRAEKEFIIQTGNAGGFDFTLNGKPGRTLGGAGVVLTDIRINADNAATFLREEKPPTSSGR